MKFDDVDHKCVRYAEWDELELIDPGLMAERRGVCQECGRVMYEQYDFNRAQDAETGEFVTP